MKACKAFCCFLKLIIIGSQSETGFYLIKVPHNSLFDYRTENIL